MRVGAVLREEIGHRQGEAGQHLQPIQRLAHAQCRNRCSGAGPPNFHLLLIRPDMHVAWRGNAPPEDPRALAAMATGH